VRSSVKKSCAIESVRPACVVAWFGFAWVLFAVGFGLVGLCGFAWVCMIAVFFCVLRGGSGFMLKVEGFGVRVEVFRLGLRV